MTTGGRMRLPLPSTGTSSVVCKCTCLAVLVVLWCDIIKQRRRTTRMSPPSKRTEHAALAMLKLMLAHKTDPDVPLIYEYRGVQKRVPLLHYAARLGAVSMVRALLDAKADVHALTHSGETVLHEAVAGTTASKGDNVKVIEQLLQEISVSGFNPTTADELDETPLELALTATTRPSGTDTDATVYNLVDLAHNVYWPQFKLGLEEELSRIWGKGAGKLVASLVVGML
jgi:hypothetical protein